MFFSLPSSSWSLSFIFYLLHTLISRPPPSYYTAFALSLIPSPLQQCLPLPSPSLPSSISYYYFIYLITTPNISLSPSTLTSHPFSLHPFPPRHFIPLHLSIIGWLYGVRVHRWRGTACNQYCGDVDWCWCDVLVLRGGGGDCLVHVIGGGKRLDIVLGHSLGPRHVPGREGAWEIKVTCEVCPGGRWRNYVCVC